MPEQKLRVLTYNVKMLPGPFGNGDADLHRADRIVQAIVATKPAWDVVCFQEVFDEEARAFFANKLKKRFPYQVAKSSDGDIFEEDSGLFFASRHPIAGSRFLEYARHSGTDALADKGIFGARLAVGDAWVMVFQTHLQSSLKEYDVRAAQLIQVRDFVRGAMKRAPGARKAFAILCGDMNVAAETTDGRHTDEYAQMLARLGHPRDLFRETHAFQQQPGYTWDGVDNKMVPKIDKDQQRLDYVFAWDRWPELHDDDSPPTIGRAELHEICVQRFETATPKLCLSDHFALDATLSLST